MTSCVSDFDGIGAAAWAGRRGLRPLPLLRYVTAARGARLQEAFSLAVEPLALTGIEQRLAHDAKDGFRPEVELVVEAVYRLHDLVGRQAGIFDVRQLL